MGEQWRTRWDGTSNSWNPETDIPEWRQQPVTNFTFAVYRSALAKLTKQKPMLEVVPPSGSSEDKEAAELCHALLTYLWRLLRKSQKLPQGIGWVLVAGHAWIRVGYDPEGGQTKPRTVPVMRKKTPLGFSEGTIAAAMAAGVQPDPEDEDMEEVEVAADENGEPYRLEDGSVDYDREPEMERSGEIDWSIVSPMAVRFNPEATSVDDATEMFVASLWQTKRAAEHFGIPESELGPPDESSEQRQLYENLASATAAGFPRSWQDQRSTWGVSQENAIGNQTLVIEYYSKPCDKYRHGRHWITAGMRKVWPPEDKEQQAAASKQVITGQDDGELDGPDAPLFENGESPLPFDFWPPLVPISDTPIPGQPSAISLLSQIVPLNEQLNFLDQKIAEKHVQDAMGGVWFASPEDKGLQITSEPGQILYSIAMGRKGQAFAPFQAKLNPLPEPVYREREVINQKILAVSGLTSNDLSQPAMGTPSGRALLVTQEASDSVLMPLLHSIEAALEESGRRELVIAQQKYREDRTIAIHPQNGKYLYRTFRNSDLRDGHDIRVQVGSAFPWSKSAQWDSKIAFLQAVPQLYLKADGSVDEAKLAKYLDSGVPGLGVFETEENPDMVEIEREHLMFEAYDPTTPDGAHALPQIAYWQNSPKHLEEHYNFMKKDRSRFEKWHPAAQEAFKAHMMATMAAVEEAAAALMPPPAPTTGADDGGAAGAGEEGGSPTPGAASSGSKARIGLVKPGDGAPGAKLTAADRAAARG